jgi:hypothetical protein
MEKDRYSTFLERRGGLSSGEKGIESTRTPEISE